MKPSPHKPIKFKDIVIRKPCHESWQEMDITTGGRYCLLCQKPVIDFSTMTEAELNAILARRKPGERLCGRFRAGQIGAPQPAAQQRRHYRWIRGAAAVVLLAGIGNPGAAWAAPHTWLPPTALPTLAQPTAEIPSGGVHGHPASPSLAIISAVVLDQHGENIEDDLALTLIFPNGTKKAITTQRGFFHLDLDAAWKPTDKVTVDIKAQTFEDAGGTREYKAVKQSLSLVQTQNWSIQVAVKYDYDMLMGDIDPGWDE